MCNCILYVLHRTVMLDSKDTGAEILYILYNADWYSLIKGAGTDFQLLVRLNIEIL